MKIGRVYKIVCGVSNIVYIGSTFNILKQRWSEHKKAFKKYLDGKKNGVAIYPYFKEHGIENFKMILVKEYQVCDKKQLEAYEQLWMNKTKCCNKQGAVNYLKQQKQKEYNEANKEQIAIKQKEHYEANKGEILARNKQYRESNKEQIAIKDRQYYEANKEQIANQRKEYYEANKEMILKKNKIKIACDNCGALVRKDGLSTHKKSKKCMNFV
jgi:hypothetical protein